jgi:glycosyltransferase involved in cell wall biosynthesis
MLTIIETHPIQYHAPVYRRVREHFGIRVAAVYGSDFSVAGYLDREFGKEFAWDTNLLSGYESIFLSKVAEGGATSDREVSARGMRTILEKLRPKAVLLPGYSPRFYQSAFRQTWRLGCPLLFRGETTDHAVKRSFVKSRVRDAALKLLYARCSRLLWVGIRSAQHFQRLGFNGAKLVFSPYCVDTAPFRCGENHRDQLRQPTRRQLGLDETDTAILFSGKISPRKGPDLLVDAVRLLPAVLRKRVVLVFLGDGELRGWLETEAKNDPVVRTNFVGFKNQRELSPFYHAADLLALPSRAGETWGLVVNEALHHGLPCVVSDAVGCAPDLIEPDVTGEVFMADSADKISAAIQQGVVMAGQAKIRGNCRNKVAGYSIEKAAEGIARAYHETTTSSQ